MWLRAARLLLWRMVMEAEGLVCTCSGVVVAVLVVAVIVVIACGDLLILLLGAVVGGWGVVLHLLECCTSNVVVVVDVVAFLDCGGFCLLRVGLFCFVDCCCVVVVLVEVACAVLVSGCVVLVV